MSSVIETLENDAKHVQSNNNIVGRGVLFHGGLLILSIPLFQILSNPQLFRNQFFFFHLQKSYLLNNSDRNGVNKQKT